MGAFPVHKSETAWRVDCIIALSNHLEVNMGQFLGCLYIVGLTTILIGCASPEDAASATELQLGESASMSSLQSLLAKLTGGPHFKADAPVFINVQDFGAIPGDGIDDGPAIQAAIDRAMAVSWSAYTNNTMLPPAPGKTTGEALTEQDNAIVFIPRGVYHLAKPIKIAQQGYHGLRSLTLIGDWATLRAIGGGASPAEAVIKIDIGFQLTIKRLILDAASKATHGLKVFKLAGHQALLEKIVVMGALDAGIKIAPSTGGVFRNVVSAENGLDGWKIFGANLGIFESCMALNNGRHGFALHTHQEFSGGAKLLAPWSVGNAGHGVAVGLDGADWAVAPQEAPTAPYGIALENGLVKSNAGDGIRVAAIDTIIRNMTISKGVPGTAASQTRAIRLRDCLAAGCNSQYNLWALGTYLVGNRIVASGSVQTSFEQISVGGKTADHFFANNHFVTVWGEETSLEPTVEAEVTSGGSGSKSTSSIDVSTGLRLLSILRNGDDQDLRAVHFFNVLDYGAVRNDGRDDAEAIRKTIKAARAYASGLRRQGDPVVYFPRGLYEVASPIVIKNYLKKQIPLKFWGEWPRLRALTYGMGSLFEFRSVDNIQLRRFAFDANHNASNGLRLTTLGPRNEFSQFRVFNARASGVRVQNATKSRIRQAASSNNGVDGWKLVDARKLHCDYCAATGNGRNGFTISGIKGTGPTLTGLWSENNNKHGVYVGSAISRTQLHLGWIEHNGQHGVVTSGPQTGVFGLRISPRIGFTSVPCTTGIDCASGVCLASGKCSAFDDGTKSIYLLNSSIGSKALRASIE